MKNKVEILSPAGSMDVLKLAIDAGCDAVYLAGKSFGARAYAPNFSEDELIDAIKYCHLYGVKVFVTVNTLIFDREIPECVKFLDFLYLNNVDGVIVQDLGLSSIIKVRYPGLKMHASTQMNAQTLDDVLVLSRLGFDRVILGREVSIDTIKEIKEYIDKNNLNIELEVFVHGALCMSYSGGCYFSSFIGGRSGNRGRCAQPCRKEYVFNNKSRYFLSPKDLCTIDNVKEIAKYVDSIKIEGRMKSKEYVYNVISSYKEALNKELSEKELNESIYNMQIAFTRSLTNGFINNVSNKDFTNVASSNHQGVLVGEVVTSVKNEVSIKLSHDLKIGDSIRFVYKNNTIDVIEVNNMYVNHNLVKLAKANTIVNLKTHQEIDSDSYVYLTKRNYDFDSKEFVKRKVDLNGSLNIIDNNLEISLSDGVNTVKRTINTEYSDKDFTERIKEQISKTGDTIYKLINITGNCNNKFVPLSIVNNCRREILEELNDLRTKSFDRNINDTMPNLSIGELSDNLKESIIIYDEELINFEDLNDDLPVELENSSFYERNSLVLPRVCHKKNNNKDAIFTNLGNISNVSSCYTNVLNSYSVRVLESLGVSIIGVSIEISKKELEELIDSYYNRYDRIPNLMMMVFGHYELMYMKHCFINKALGYTNKGCKECKKDILFDNLYPVYGDSECNLSILSRDCVNLTKFIEDLKDIGIKHFLYDFTKVTEIEMSGLFNHNGGYYGHYIKNIE